MKNTLFIISGLCILLIEIAPEIGKNLQISLKNNDFLILTQISGAIWSYCAIFHVTGPILAVFLYKFLTISKIL